MSKDDHDESTARLLVEVRNVLTDTERQNAQRHIELVAAVVRGKVDVLGRLHALAARLAKIAKAMAALDAQT